jgi:hypothetical protein
VVPPENWKNSGLRGPENVEFFFDACEISVAGGESGFAMGGEGSGEIVGVGEFVFSTKFGRAAGQVEISNGSWAMSSMTLQATPGPLARQVE